MILWNKKYSDKMERVMNYDFYIGSSKDSITYQTNKREKRKKKEAFKRALKSAN